MGTQAMLSLVGLSAVSSQSNDLGIGVIGNMISGKSNTETLSTIKNISNVNFEMMFHTGSLFPGNAAYNKSSYWENKIKPAFEYLDMNNVVYSVIGREDWTNDVTSIFKFTKDPAYRQMIGTKMIQTSFWYYVTRSIYVPSRGAFLNGPNSAVNLGVAFIDTHAWCNPNVLVSSKDHDQHVEVEKYLQTFNNNGLSYKFVVGDAPIFSSASGTNACLYNTLLPLLEKYDIQLYISGADHSGEIITYRDINFLNVGHFNRVTQMAFKDIGSDVVRHFYAENNGFAVLKLRQDHIKIDMLNAKGATVAYSHRLNPSFGARGVTNMKSSTHVMPHLPEEVVVNESFIAAGVAVGTSGALVSFVSGTIGLMYILSMMSIGALTLVARHQRNNEKI